MILKTLRQEGERYIFVALVGGERKRAQRGMRAANPTLPTAPVFFSDAANIVFYSGKKNKSNLYSVSCRYDG